ncbi:hypothetical protein BGW38_000925 [Lunasporangiospora selenospora]|uniref:Uncharacterized protein n=1 Tax=Lunasporangiospora selenospora TaxID=979761 RepID=A0A9P6FUT3_9FUNG|nr:hypothetical protein BGW38_000925 [Lunasporangiospora selenospora]
MPSISTTTRTYLDDPVTKAKLDKHQLVALALLVTGDLTKLDPASGDASCQVRAVIVLHMALHLRTELKHDQWGHAELLAASFLEAHKNDQPDTKTKTVEDAQGAAHSPKYDQFAAFVRLHILGEETWELLGLCYSLWVSGIISTDEFWIDFRYRSNNQWHDHEKILRARLAELSCSKFIAIAKTLPDGNILTKALEVTRSVIKDPGVPAVPVFAIQPTFAAATAFAYKYNIPIIMAVIRIQLDGDAEGDSLDADKYPDLGESELASDMIYSLGAARTLFYLPDKATGRFKLVPEPTEKQRQAQGLFIKSWSTYHRGSTDDGLFSADHDKYFSALSTANIEWLFDVYTALHAPFCRRAEHWNMDVAALYKHTFGTRSKAFVYDRFDCQGLDYRTVKDHRPTQLERLTMSTHTALKAGLSRECQVVRMAAPADRCTWRITKAVDWQLSHVHAGTVSWAETRLQAMTECHMGSPHIVIGRFVFALGSMGVSCKVEAFATELHNTKNKRNRKNKYLAVYPNNKLLLDRSWA